MSQLSLIAFGLCSLLATTQGACGGDSNPSLFNAKLLSFSTGPSLDAVEAARSATIADFNGDGVPDIALATSAGITRGAARILLGKGDGTFQSATAYPTEVGSEMIAAADFNGDGRVDLVVSNYKDGSISTLLNQGAGTFGASMRTAVDPQPFRLVVADVNGDGRPDIIVPCSGSSNIAVMLSRGDGTFNRVDSTVNGSPGTVAVGNLVGDSKLDIVAASSGGSAVHVLTGIGGGSFQETSSVPSAGFVSQILLGDVNGDGKLDVLTSNSSVSQGSVSLLLQSSSGTLNAFVTVATGAAPEGMALSDFNGDGKLDLAVDDDLDGSLKVLLGDGLGGFTPSFTAQIGGEPSILAVGDLNHDGKPDIVVPTLNSHNVTILLNSSR